MLSGSVTNERQVKLSAGIRPARHLRKRLVISEQRLSQNKSFFWLRNDNDTWIGNSGILHFGYLTKRKSQATLLARRAARIGQILFFTWSLTFPLRLFLSALIQKEDMQMSFITRRRRSELLMSKMETWVYCFPTLYMIAYYELYSENLSIFIKC